MKLIENSAEIRCNFALWWTLLEKVVFVPNSANYISGHLQIESLLRVTHDSFDRTWKQVSFIETTVKSELWDRI